MTDRLVVNAVAQAKRAIDRFGKPATIKWPGAGASLTQNKPDEIVNIQFVPGKRTSRVVTNQTVVEVQAIMSPVARNPIGATITFEGHDYKVVSSRDVGQAPSTIAAHFLVVV